MTRASRPCIGANHGRDAHATMRFRQDLGVVAAAVNTAWKPMLPSGGLHDRDLKARRLRGCLDCDRHLCERKGFYFDCAEIQ